MGLWDNVEVKEGKIKDEFSLNSEAKRYKAIEDIADLIKNNDKEKENLHNLLLEKALIKRY